MKFYNVSIMWIMMFLAGGIAEPGLAEERKVKWPEHIQIVLDATEPLEFDRGKRLPLYLWQAMNPGLLDQDDAQELVELLDERGIGVVTSWNPGKREQTLAESMSIAKAQKKLGLRVNINATSCLYSFFNGDERTAHIDDDGKPFWDSSFGKQKMGCPFTLDFRKPHIRERLEYFIKAFKKNNLNVDFIFADWEIDGPVEFNKAHAASKRCRRCRRNIRDIDNFEHFQQVLRTLRSALQREVYAEPITKNFPGALVGNYGVYPHNGYRYWYDYYEYYVEGQPYQIDQLAQYRKWYDEFPETGYTFAMPVVYTWRRIFDWYGYVDTDYRWFYNMLLVTSNVGRHTPDEIPIISFVHWHTIKSDDHPGTAIQFSEEKYQELLWHMLLRGTDTFFMWCPKKESPKEIRLVHQVYAQAQQYGQFLSEGKPILFNVPRQPGTVISALKLKGSLLVRRTDFKRTSKPVEIIVGDKKIKVKAMPGRCQIITLK
jgi:hypothetical protein